MKTGFCVPICPSIIYIIIRETDWNPSIQIQTFAWHRYTGVKDAFNSLILVLVKDSLTPRSCLWVPDGSIKAQQFSEVTMSIPEGV